MKKEAKTAKIPDGQRKADRALVDAGFKRKDIARRFGRATRSVRNILKGSVSTRDPGRRKGTRSALP